MVFSIRVDASEPKNGMIRKDGGGKPMDIASDSFAGKAATASAPKASEAAGTKEDEKEKTAREKIEEAGGFMAYVEQLRKERRKCGQGQGL